MASQSGPEGPWPTGARWRVRESKLIGDPTSRYAPPHHPSCGVLPLPTSYYCCLLGCEKQCCCSLLPRQEPGGPLAPTRRSSVHGAQHARPAVLLVERIALPCGERAPGKRGIRRVPSMPPRCRPTPMVEAPLRCDISQSWPRVSSWWGVGAPGRSDRVGRSRLRAPCPPRRAM